MVLAGQPFLVIRLGNGVGVRDPSVPIADSRVVDQK